MNKGLTFYLSILLVLFAISCNRTINTGQTENESQSEKNGKMNTRKSSAGPPVYIYKTRNDYYNKVPVTLSENKDKVINYPGIKDVYSAGKPTYPTRLAKDYLLDNRGINKNTAFLNLTYEAYAHLLRVPKPEKLFEMVLDNDPFTELYYCGSRYDFKDPVTELNEKIDNNTLSDFTRLK